MGITSYSATAALNTAINGVNVSEGMARSDVNNAFREMMADLKTYSLGASSPTYPITVALGGTNSITAGAALTALGAFPAAGGTVTGNITRTSSGIHPYFASTSMTGGRIYIQASGADPTSSPGDIVFEY